jgi:fibronectin type 3 domain-containing protein
MFVLMPATAPPAAPTGVTAKAVSSSEIDLAWSAVAGALSYQVQRSTDSVNWSTIATPSANSYANTGLSAASTYSYQILAVGAIGTGTPSASVSATTLNVASNLPAGWTDADIGTPAPAGSAAVAGTTWTVNGSGAGIGNTADQINFASAAVTGNFAAVARVTSLTNTDSGAAAGVMFRDSAAAGSMFVGVFATEGSGVSLQWRSATDAVSGSFSIGTVLTPTPTNPISLRLVKSGSNFTGFYSVNGVAWTQLGATLSIGFTNVTYRAGLAVTAHNNGVLSTATFTNVSLAKTAPPPAVPTGLHAVSISASQINLSWTASAGATGYQVQRSTDNIHWSVLAAPTAVRYADTGLASATRYYYRVLAVKLGSFSAPSAMASAVTRPPAPTGLAATVLSASQIRLTWTATPGATSYRIQRSTNNATWTQLATTTATTFTNTLLAAGTVYYYRIVAFDVGGGTVSTSVNASTIPAKPTGLAVTSLTSGQVNLTWAAVHGATGYELQRSADNVAWSPLAAPTTHSYADAGLPPGTRFYYRVLAVGVSGVSAASASVTTATRPAATFVPGTPPTAPNTPPYVFSVTYQSSAGINTASINTGDIQVTGANGFLRTPTLLHFVTNADGSVTATYSVAPPAGGWKPGLTYTVKLVASQVSDKNGTIAAGAPLGTFSS